MTITAIILNYNNYDDVYVCISSLENQILPSYYNLKILIIDNNSKDSSSYNLQKKFPQHDYIFNQENLGFAKGVNQGIDFSYDSTDYFLLVNNDAILDKNCLNLLLSVSKGTSLIAPAIYYKNKPDTVWQGGGFFSKLRMNLFVPDKNKIKITNTLQEVEYLSGCILLIPKVVIEKIGKFDQTFFFYGEDLDFCLRAKKAGIKILYFPKSKSWHNIKRIASSRTNPFVLYNLAFSFLLIVKKHFPALRFYGLFLFIFLYTPFRLFQIISGGNDWKNIFSWIGGGVKAWKIKI